MSKVIDFNKYSKKKNEGITLAGGGLELLTHCPECGRGYIHFCLPKAVKLLKSDKGFQEMVYKIVKGIQTER